MSQETLAPFSTRSKSIKKGIYEHYKGNTYKVIAVGRHSENLEEMVIYQDCSDESKWWIRPVSLFLETISIEDKEIPRFRFLREVEL
ncbi:MAG: DUF1653 domain-containing protein [Chlamydiae bacterium]|jgi:hypothetical protein|nr:DUF1653 domain-containing protein [Chlamydiota bacterium]